jgi:membrane dipeptidase
MATQRGKQSDEGVDAKWAKLFGVEFLADATLATQADSLCFKCKCSHGCKNLLTDIELHGYLFWQCGLPLPGTDSSTLSTVISQLDGVKEKIKSLHGITLLARTASDLRNISARNEIASVIGLLGPQSFEGSMAALRMLAELGISYLTLSDADIASSPSGLLAELVREANRLGLVLHVVSAVDVTVAELVKLSAAPVLLTPLSTLSAPGLSDQVLRLVSRAGGVVLPAPAGHPSGKALVIILERLVRLLGVGHVGFATSGLDDPPAQSSVRSVWREVRHGLMDMHLAIADIDKIMGGNFARVWEAAEDKARR